MKIDVCGMEVEVTPKTQNKHLRLRVVPPRGEIRISCPPRTSVKRIERFVIDNLSWIQKAKGRACVAPERLGYLSGGNTLEILGVHYNVIESDGVCFSLDLGAENAFLRTPKGATREQKESFVKRYLKSVAEREFPPRIARFEAVIGVKASGIGYRFMTSRWGSCNVKTKHINFSVYAVRKPQIYLDYLVCHELLHIIYPNHGREFKAALRRILPDADKISKLK